MGTYKRVKDVSKRFAGVAVVYKVDPPMQPYSENDGPKFDYVVASAADVPNSGPETYLFPSTKDGEVLSFIELGGSYRGGLNHGQAFNNAGYYEAEQP